MAQTCYYADIESNRSTKMFDRILETRIAQTLLWEFLPEVILIAVWVAVVGLVSLGLFVG